MEGRTFVYIMASQPNGTIYIGSSVDLAKRVWEHRNDVVEGFTKRYRCHTLVWYEAHDDWEAARQRELHMKEWSAPGSCVKSKGSIPRGKTCMIASHYPDSLPNWAPAFAGVD
jgi:putative endonuclease